MLGYWFRMSSLRNWPEGGSCQFDRTLIGFDEEGEGLHGLAVASWSCRKWLQAIFILGSAIVSTCGAKSKGQVCWNPESFPFSVLMFSTSEDREWISFACTLISPGLSLLLPDRSASLHPIEESGRTCTGREKHL